jgi:hypothetical protein
MQVFFFNFYFNNQCSQIPFERLSSMFLCALCNDYWILINVPKFHSSICSMFLCEMNVKSWIPPLQVSSLKPIVTYHRWLLLLTYTSTTSVNLCIDYQRWLAHQLLASICTLIIIIACCCWLVHQLLTLTCVLTIRTQHWLLGLSIGAWIDYQLWHLHQLSTSTICVLTFCKSQSIIKSIITVVVAPGFSQSIVEAIRALGFPNFYYAFKLFNAKFLILLDKDWQ